MIVEENSVLAQLVKTNITLLQKCLTSSNKAIFIAAIENLKYPRSPLNFHIETLRTTLDPPLTSTCR